MYIYHMVICLLLCLLSIPSSSSGQSVIVDSTVPAFTCIDHDECNIDCNASNTCYGGKIYSQSRDTTVQCLSHGACSQTHISCGNLSHHQSLESNTTTNDDVRLNDCTLSLSANTMHSNVTLECRDMDDCTVTNSKSSSFVHSTINCVRVRQCTLFCPTDTSCIGSTMRCHDTSNCLCLGDGCKMVDHSGSSLYESPLATKLVMVTEKEDDLWYNIPVPDLIFINVLCFIFCGCCCCGLIMCGLIKVSVKSIQYHRSKLQNVSSGNGGESNNSQSPQDSPPSSPMKPPMKSPKKSFTSPFKSPFKSPSSYLKTPTMGDHVPSHSGNVSVDMPVDEAIEIRKSSSLQPRRQFGQFGFRSFSKNSSKNSSKKSSATPYPMQSIDLDNGSTASIVYMAPDHDEDHEMGTEVVYDQVDGHDQDTDYMDKTDGDESGSESTDESATSGSDSSRDLNHRDDDHDDVAYAGRIMFKNSLSARDPADALAPPPRTTTPTYVSALALHAKVSNITDIPEDAVSENTYTVVFGNGTPRNMRTGSPFQSSANRKSMDQMSQVSEGIESLVEELEELEDLSIKVNVGASSHLSVDKNDRNLLK